MEPGNSVVTLGPCCAFHANPMTLFICILIICIAIAVSVEVRFAGEDE